MEEAEEEEGNHMQLRTRAWSQSSVPVYTPYYQCDLDKLLNFSVPRFPHLYNEANKITCGESL